VSEERAFDDPVTAPYWEAAARRELVLQHCEDCGSSQLYPRPMCLRCNSLSLTWKQAAGRGRVHSLTTVHIAVVPELEPPYVVALVDLEEGPRVLTNVVGGPCAIGDEVRLAWREREAGPPVPVFEPA
jgi:uncharacterized OB-fold protein